ncbi:MAG: hypothetical protein HYU98_01345 [Deltaproteobacteria bacterium]|nr:hypothetical protein [Deltaproteobacteria bacterium]
MPKNILEEGEDYCPNCGQYTRGEGVCANCGAILDSNNEDEFEGFHEDDENLDDDDDL